MTPGAWLAAQAALTAATVAIYFLASARPWFPGSSVVSVALVLSGLGVVLVARYQLGSSFEVSPAPRSDAELVTHGIYSQLRHPIYTGLLAMLTGALLERTPAISLPAILANVWFYQAKARAEERWLLDRHPTYASYRGRTRGVLGW